MSEAPLTILDVPSGEEEAIRLAVRNADVSLLSPRHRIATRDDIAGLIDLLSDPRVSDPIYDLPRPFTTSTIGTWIEKARTLQTKGEAVLAVISDVTAKITGYSYFTVWPDRSAAELAGAHIAEAQNKGTGKTGAARSFGWMFEHLGVRLIGVTAALDNMRSARVIGAAGFVDKGERESRRPDGSARRSRYWELTRDQWRALHATADEYPSTTLTQLPADPRP